MTFKKHFMLSFIAATAFYMPVSSDPFPDYTNRLFFAFVLGSMLPDIDIYIHNPFSRLFKKRNLLFFHKGITHHLIPWYILSFLAFYSNNDIFTAFVCGGLFHLFIDAFSITGIPYLRDRDRIAIQWYSENYPISEQLFFAILVISLFLISGLRYVSYQVFILHRSLHYALHTLF